MNRKVWPYSDVVSENISIYEGQDIFLEHFRGASATERLSFAAYWLQAEILNGGISQFFSNDTGVLAPEAVEACRAFGLPKLASKIEEAMKWFGAPYPRERESREEALSSAEADPFADIEDDVVALIYEENSGLEHAARSYLESHGG